MRNTLESWAAQLVDAISVKALLPLRNRLKNDYRYSHVAEVDRFNELTHDEIENHQLRRIRHIVAVASESSTFYSDRVRSAGIHDIANMSFEQFAAIKPLTKNDLREHRSAMVNRQFAPSALIERRSGGTTAAPVSVFLDSESINRRESATASFNKWFGFRPGQKIAYLWAAVQDLPKLATWKARIQNQFVDRQLFLPSAPLDDDIMESYWRRLDKFRPTLLQAFSSPLAEMAEFLLRTGRRLNLNAVSTTAEVLHPHQRRAIKKAFGTDPFNWVGAREVGRIATQCKLREGMHINCYGLYIEVVENPSFTSEKTGDILITDLWNEAMPIIRYRIGDIGRLDTSVCGCGSHLPCLSDILGRATDTFLNSKGQKIPGMVMVTHIYDDVGVNQLQLIQYDIGRFEARIVPGDSFENPGSIKRLQDIFCDYMCEELELKVRIVDEIPREPSGKLRICKNEMKDAE